MNPHPKSKGAAGLRSRVHRIRAWLTAVAVGVLAASAAAPAAALTTAPAGNYYFSSSNPQLRLSSNGQSVSCTWGDSTFDFSTTGTGWVTDIPGLTGCSNAVLGTMTVTQLGSWSFYTTLSSSRIDVSIWIPLSGWRFTGAGCTFAVGGTITLSAPISGLPNALNAFSVSSSALTIRSNNGGFTCFAFPVGLAVTYTADYAISRTMSVWG